MKTTHPIAGPAYAIGYAKGRHAAKAHLALKQNPFRPDTLAYQGWNDGHYDEESARRVAIASHSALLWSSEGRN